MKQNYEIKIVMTVVIRKLKTSKTINSHTNYYLTTNYFILILWSMRYCIKIREFD